MKNIRIEIDGATADHFGAASLNLALQKIGYNPLKKDDLSVRGSGMAYTFPLPQTVTNNLIFNFANVNDIANRFNKAKKQVMIYVNEEPIFSGTIKIQEITESEYKVFVVGAGADWTVLLGDRLIRYAEPVAPDPAIPDYVEGALTAYNGKTIQAVYFEAFGGGTFLGGQTTILEWTNNLVPDPTVTRSVFAPVAYGKQYQIPNVSYNFFSGTYNFAFFPKESICEQYTYLGVTDYNRMTYEDFRPCPYVIQVLKWIFSGIGYAVGGSIFEDFRFKNLFVPYTNPEGYVWNWGTLLAGSQERLGQYDYRAFGFGLTGWVYFNFNNDDTDTSGRLNLVWLHTPRKDLSNNPIPYDTLNNYTFQWSVYDAATATTPNQIKYVAKQSGTYRFRFKFKIAEYVITWTDIGGFTPGMAPAADLRAVAQIYKTEVGGTLAFQDANYLLNGVQSGANALNVLDFLELTTAPTLTGFVDTPGVGIVTRTYSYNNTVYLELDSDNLYPNGVDLEKGDTVWFTFATLFNFLGGGQAMTYKNFKIEDVVVTAEFEGDLELNLTRNLPDGVTCVDFVKSLMTMFNLYAVTDPVNKVVQFEPFESAIGKPAAAYEYQRYDLETRKGVKIERRPLPLNRNNAFDYQDDTGDVIVPKGFGDFVQFLSADYFEGTQNFSVLFSPTGRFSFKRTGATNFANFLLMSTKEGWTTPSNTSGTDEADWTDSIEENTTDFNPRIALINGSQTVLDSVLFRYWDDGLQLPVNGVPSNLPDPFFAPLLTFDTLYEEYYAFMLNLFLRSELVVFESVVDEQDFKNMNPYGKLIKIGNDYYIVRMVDNYQPTLNGSAKLELLKFIP